MADTHEALDLDAIEARLAGIDDPCNHLYLRAQSCYDCQRSRSVNFCESDDVPALVVEVRRLRAIETRLKRVPAGETTLRWILTGQEGSE